MKTFYARYLNSVEKFLNNVRLSLNHKTLIIKLKGNKMILEVPFKRASHFHTTQLETGFSNS